VVYQIIICGLSNNYLWFIKKSSVVDKDITGYADCADVEVVFGAVAH